MRFTIILYLILACLRADADTYDVYILAGQSNAGGHGYVSRDFSLFSPSGDDGLAELGKSNYLQPQPDAIFNHWRGGNPSAAHPVLWDARSDGWIPMRAGYSLFGYNSSSPSALGTETSNHPFGAEVTFAERMRQGRPGHKVAIVKYSQGATSLGSAAAPGAWDPTSGRNYVVSSNANAGHCYSGLLQLVRESIADLTSRGHTVTIRGMIWHQGENDSGLTTAAYKDRLKDFITAIRTDLGKPDLPFIIGELIQTSYANTRAAQKLAAAESSNAAFVSSVVLKGDSTTIHFDTLGQLELGRRYAEAMLRFGPAMRRTVAHWKLDETSLTFAGGTFGTFRDSEGGTDGVLYGYAAVDAATVAASVINRDGPEAGQDRAVDFAPDSGISAINTNRPDALPASGDFTLLVWMNTTQPHTTPGHLFSNDNGQAGRARLLLSNSSLSWSHDGGVNLTETNSPIFDGKWHRVGISRKGNAWSLLRDGNIVATGTSAASIAQDTEWMIGRARSYSGNYEGLVGDVLVLNYAFSEPFRIESSQFVPAGECRIAWTSQPGFEYGVEWSLDLAHWNPLGIIPASPETTTDHRFPDPGNGSRLFVRIR